MTPPLPLKYHVLLFEWPLKLKIPTKITAIVSQSWLDADFYMYSEMLDQMLKDRAKLPIILVL